MGVARQPPRNTVIMTMMIVVEKNIRRISVLVFLIAREKAMAPRSPLNMSMCCRLKGISGVVSSTDCSAEVGCTKGSLLDGQQLHRLVFRRAQLMSALSG